MENYIFSIEGNIGSGKSTFVDKMEKTLHTIRGYKIIYLQEPVDVWKTICDKDGKNIIEKYYDNNKKYAFSFQMMAYISRLTKLKDILKNNNNSIIITERSLYTDKFVFCKMLYDDEKIEEVNYTIYLKWFDYFIQDISISNIIYINTSPIICSNRIKQRGRKGENIPLEYLQKCHDYHEEFCNNDEFNVLFLDGNIDINNSDYNDWIDIVKTFIIDQAKITNYHEITFNAIMDHPFF
jgi:deoxyadenosine/deoxycytidine kinase